MSGRWSIGRVSSGRRSTGRVSAAVALVLVVTGCGLVSPGFSVGAGGIRTFPLRDGVMCEAYGLVDPVGGRLVPGTDPREPAVLETPDGRTVSVVWPEGFSLEPGPPMVLRDDRGREVAREGQGVVLAQTRADDAAGTWDDPYLASGLIFQGCYAPAR